MNILIACALDPEHKTEENVPMDAFIEWYYERDTQALMPHLSAEGKQVHSTGVCVTCFDALDSIYTRADMSR